MKFKVKVVKLVLLTKTFLTPNLSSNIYHTMIKT